MQQLLIANRLLPLGPPLCRPLRPRLLRAVLTLVSQLQPQIVNRLLPLCPPLPSCRPLRPRLLRAVLMLVSLQLLQLVGEQEQEHGEAAGCGRQAAVAVA